MTILAQLVITIVAFSWIRRVTTAGEQRRLVFARFQIARYIAKTAYSASIATLTAAGVGSTEVQYLNAPAATHTFSAATLYA